MTNTKPLGRRPPPDWNHVEKYPLTRRAAAALSPTPVILGVNWYENFDNPQKDSAGRSWIGRDKNNLGRLRGGHCVCLKPPTIVDPVSWWSFYDQGHEGACVGFGSSRAMSLMNRKRYLARWLWDRAKEIDVWPETNPGDDEGTSVRAALDVLRARGHVTSTTARERMDAPQRASLKPALSEGIAANRWIRSMDDLAQVLGLEGREYVSILNSWGRDGYPHYTYMPLETVEVLWERDGELGVVVDR